MSRHKTKFSSINTFQLLLRSQLKTKCIVLINPRKQINNKEGRIPLRVMVEHSRNESTPISQEDHTVWHYQQKLAGSTPHIGTSPRMSTEQNSVHHTILPSCSHSPIFSKYILLYAIEVLNQICLSTRNSNPCVNVSLLVGPEVLPRL
jgi:hypothetical protein